MCSINFWKYLRKFCKPYRFGSWQQLLNEKQNLQKILLWHSTCHRTVRLSRFCLQVLENSCRYIVLAFSPISTFTILISKLSEISNNSTVFLLLFRDFGTKWKVFSWNWIWCDNFNHISHTLKAVFLRTFNNFIYSQFFIYDNFKLIAFSLSSHI